MNGLLSLTAITLPLAGTVSAIALANPDDVETVSVVTGAATVAVMGLNLLFKPQAKSAKAAACERFLSNALTSINQRWDRNTLGAIQGTPEEWRMYLAVRASLDAGRKAAC